MFTFIRKLFRTKKEAKYAMRPCSCGTMHEVPLGTLEVVCPYCAPETWGVYGEQPQGIIGSGNAVWRKRTRNEDTL